jgi:predicted N-acetyltransferase YhbS
VAGTPPAPRAVRLRDAELDDMPALRRVFRDASLSNAGDRAVLLAHPDALELADTAVRERRTRVATAGGEVVGFATVADADGGMELEDLFVDPAWMRRGVGRALIWDVGRIGRDRGVERVVVTGNPHARAFYESVGFVEDGETTTAFGPGLRMHLDLGRPDA